jgi:hypothetical protein
MDTLENVLNDVAKFVGASGSCPDDPIVLTGINNARRVLYKLGDWECMCEPVCIHSFECGITLPSRFAYAKTAHTCGIPVVINNGWYTSVPVWGEYAGRAVGNLVQMPGSFVTFRDWPCTPGREKCCPKNGFYLGITLENPADVGVELTFKGHGVSREHVSVTRTVDSAAFVMDGPDFGEYRYSQLTHLIKPVTKGRIRLYGYDGANKVLLAHYDQDDLNPQFTRYYAPRGRGPYMIKAKKRYIPLRGDATEIVDISADVLIHALQALTEREARNLAGYRDSISSAVALLNKEDAGPQATSTSPIRMSRAYKVTGLTQ